MTVRYLALAIALLAAAAPRAAAQRSRFEVPAWEGRWYRGNTHSHTTQSDGDSPPEVVARWYRDHGYAFLVLSDHNIFTDPRTLSHLVDSTFLLIPGEELSSAFDSLPVHVNGLNIPGYVAPRRAPSLLGTVQANVDAVREVSGVPHINHPNFRWALPAEILAQVRNDRLLEIFNAHPLVHNQGGGGRPGLEAVWDDLLTRGLRIFGIAVDDAHHFTGEFNARRANPGRGWIVVRAPRLEAPALMEALEAGRFYASTGVELADIRVTPTRLEVHITPDGDARFTTTFIGSGGRVLARTGANPAVYELHDATRYVRAKVVDSGGGVAWVQPVFVAPR